MSPFRQRIYRLIRKIPKGKVMGYGHVAAALGHPGAARQVGYALAALPAGTDVPWQRVVRSSGELAMQGDVTRPILQRALLEDEGVSWDGDKVDMGESGWSPEVGFEGEESPEVGEPEGKGV